MSYSFRIYDAYGPFDDLPGVSDFEARYGLRLRFSGNTAYSIKGCNGSGKDGLINTIMSYEPNLQYIASGNYILATIFPSYNIVAVGKYSPTTKNGGGDTIRHPTEELPALFRFISETIPDYSVLMTGAMLSTYDKPAICMMESFPSKKTIHGFMSTTYETCLERLKLRSGKEKEYSSVLSKFRYISGVSARYETQGWFVEHIHTNSYEEMLQCYIDIETKYKDPQ